jgi:Zn-dependent protease
MGFIALGILWYTVFVISLTFHEAAHAFAGLTLGDNTAAKLGLATLDPMPHIKREPAGTVIIPVLAFVFFGWMLGWASTPFSAYWAEKNRKKSALASLAGPAANLALVLLAGAAIKAGIAFNIFELPEQIAFDQITTASSAGFANSLAVFVSIVFSLNLILFVFNLIPLPPFDGSNVLFFFLSPAAAEKYHRMISHAHYRIIGLIVAWNLLGICILPVRKLALSVLYPGISF